MYYFLHEYFYSNIPQRFQRERNAQETDEREIRIPVIHWNSVSGLLRFSRKNVHKIGDNSIGSDVKSCYLGMSEKRFRFLLRCIRFEDITDQLQRKKLDKMTAIRKVLELFLTNFKEYLVASEYLTLI